MPKIPLKWLAESVDLVPGSTPEDVAAAFARVGLEEEGIEGGGVTGPLVVGRVLSLVKEPQSNGKTINYCRVDVGELNDPAGPGHAPDDGAEYPSSRGIVCGAHNFVEGDWVVVVLPGRDAARAVPHQRAQDVRPLVRRHDLLPARARLGRGSRGHHRAHRHSDSSAEDLIPGQDAITLLGLDESTIEINVTPDRGYSFSIRGVAREYSHATDQEFRDPAGIAVTGTPGAGFAVSIEDQAPIRDTVGCDRFAPRILRGFDPAAPSPTHMKRRLEQAGMRSISLAVDVTNYVMLELGHPLHAYDLAKVTAPLVVRRASGGEKLTTLDGAERNLDLEDILVSTARAATARAPWAWAASWAGSTPRSARPPRTSCSRRRTGIRSRSRARRGGTSWARRRRGATSAAWTRRSRPSRSSARCGSCRSTAAARSRTSTRTSTTPSRPSPIAIDVEFPGAIVGVLYEPDEVVASLEKVGCAVDAKGDNPARHPAHVAAGPRRRRSTSSRRWRGCTATRTCRRCCRSRLLGAGYTHAQQVRRSVARTLAESGLTEVLTYPFMSPARLDDMLIPEGDIRRDVVRLANPLSAEQPVMRTAILETLVDAVKVNLSRGAQDVAIYEIGRAYLRRFVGAVPRFEGATITPEVVEAVNAAIPGQVRRVAGVMTGHRVLPSWNHAGEAFDWSDALAAANLVARVAGVELVVSRDVPEGHSTMPYHPGRAAVLRCLPASTWAWRGSCTPRCWRPWVCRRGRWRSSCCWIRWWTRPRARSLPPLLFLGARWRRRTSRSWFLRPWLPPSW